METMKCIETGQIRVMIPLDEDTILGQINAFYPRGLSLKLYYEIPKTRNQKPNGAQ